MHGVTNPKHATQSNQHSADLLEHMAKAVEKKREENKIKPLMWIEKKKK